MHKWTKKADFFKSVLDGFVQWMQRLNYSEDSIKGRRIQLNYFTGWLLAKDITNLTQITTAHLQQYNQHLHNRPVKTNTIRGYISVLKLLNNYLHQYGEAPLPLVPLPIVSDIKTERTILTTKEISTLYNSCDSTVWGMRDKAMIALFYGCGLRSKEGTALELNDIDFNNGLVHIKKGKNYKERYVPMSEGVSNIIKQWLAHGHSIFCTQTNYILPNRYGKKSQGTGMNNRLKKLCTNAAINKNISLHCLRHSIATHLLSSGMPLDQISTFLGHQGLEATQIYTRIENENKHEL
jgi:integrase/recombinase XerD